MERMSFKVRHEQWRQIVTNCQNREPGMTKKAWCERNGIKERAYHYWAKKFRDEDLIRIARQSSYAEPDIESSTLSPPAFADVTDLMMLDLPDETVTPDEPPVCDTPAIRLRYGDFDIDINNNASAKLLKTVMGALHNA